MKKILVLVLLVASAGWLFVTQARDSRFRFNLKQFAESEQSEIALHALTNFPWDEVCVFAAYADETVARDLAKGYEITSHIPFFGNDNQWALLFKDTPTKTAFFIDVSKISALSSQTTMSCFKKNVSLQKNFEDEAPDTYQTLTLKN